MGLVVANEKILTTLDGLIVFLTVVIVTVVDTECLRLTC